MTIRLQIGLIICIALFLVLIIRLLKKNQLEMRYTILWFVTAFLLILIVIFPSILTGLTSSLGIVAQTNGVFAIALLFTLIVLLSITSIVSNLTKKNKEIAQYCAILENKIRKIEEQQSGKN